MAKKRANGEGNIRKRADGRWEGRYTAGYHPETGKRIIKNVLGKTQAECKAKPVSYTHLCLENPSTYQCWPSYATIGKAIGRTKNTVMQYVDCLLYTSRCV